MTLSNSTPNLRCISKTVTFFWLLALSLLCQSYTSLVQAEQAQSNQAGINPKVLIETSIGSITVELFADRSPITVANFLGYVDSGFYAETIFHRVIPNFMIQGGGFTKEMVMKPVKEPIKNESNNKLNNLRGTLAMARTSDPDSAASQFFINIRDNLNLDFNYRYGRAGYTVFGRVESGMEVVDGISLEETGYYGNRPNVPLQPIIIKSITRLNRQ